MGREGKELDNARLRDFLADSLALWRVAGRVEAGEAPVVAVVRADDGAIVWIERPPGDAPPCRWLVRWRAAGEDPGGPREERPRPCASLVGVLGAMRGALGVNRGSAVRIASPGDEGRGTRD
jgi:hypothetical protein